MAREAIFERDPAPELCFVQEEATLRRPLGGRMVLRHRFKSSDSSNSNECVEVAAALSTVHVRDSKSPQGAQLALAPEAWVGFLAYTVGH